VVGLVASAQLTSPSKFELARDYIYAKWPSNDPFVLTYREWLIAFERFRSDLIARKRPMPNLLFDEILGYLHSRISNEEMADYDDISRFFDLGNGSFDKLKHRRAAAMSAASDTNHQDNKIRISRSVLVEQMS
jgi:hypothetical protein